MNACETEIKKETFRLAKEAFDAFCADIEAMFGIEVKCQPQEQQDVNCESLKKHFKKFCSVNTVAAHGAIDGSFYLIFDQEALFSLAGIFAMLPEDKILENIKFGTEEQAQKTGAVIEDAGNLLAGAWDRIFRENVETHKQFLRTETFTGNPWRSVQKSFGIKKNTAMAVCFYELTAGNLPPFSCCAAFPETVFSKADETAQAEQIDNAQEKSENPENQQKVIKAETTADDNIFSILGLKAVDVMNKNIQWCRPDCTVEKAIEQMQRTKVEYLLVGIEQKIQGVLAMSDLSSAVSIYLRPMFAKWKRELDEATLKIKVQCVMGKPVRTITPETTFDVIVKEIVRSGGCLVVADGDEKTLGIITGKDCLASLLR